MQTRQTIFIVSPEPWGINFVSKHHYATLLAAQGHAVYFINPPSNRDQIAEISPNLWVVDYKVRLRGLNRLPGFIRNFIYKRQIAHLFSICGIQKVDIIWSFDPYRFQDLSIFENAKKIYHAVDIHHTPLEQICTQTADCVLSTTDLILKRFTQIADTKKHKINHGVAAHFLDYQPVENPMFFRSNRCNVGYVGNLLYQYMDRPTLLKIIIEHSETCDFYFIGSYKSSNLGSAKEGDERFIKQLQSLDNVFLLGAKPTTELPAYMNQFDLHWLCYTGAEHPAEMANPHKMLEYLSAGKPVVCHYIYEYAQRSDLVCMAASASELPAVFTQAVENLEALSTPEAQQMRRDFARANSYALQLERIEQILAKK